MSLAASGAQSQQVHNVGHLPATALLLLVAVIAGIVALVALMLQIIKAAVAMMLAGLRILLGIAAAVSVGVVLASSGGSAEYTAPARAPALEAPRGPDDHVVAPAPFDAPPAPVEKSPSEPRRDGPH